MSLQVNFLFEWQWWGVFVQFYFTFLPQIITLHSCGLLRSCNVSALWNGASVFLSSRFLKDVQGLAFMDFFFSNIFWWKTYLLVLNCAYGLINWVCGALFFYLRSESNFSQFLALGQMCGSEVCLKTDFGPSYFGHYLNKAIHLQREGVTDPLLAFLRNYSQCIKDFSYKLK